MSTFTRGYTTKTPVFFWVWRKMEKNPTGNPAILGESILMWGRPSLKCYFCHGFLQYLLHIESIIIEVLSLLHIFGTYVMFSHVIGCIWINWNTIKTSPDDDLSPQRHWDLVWCRLFPAVLHQPQQVGIFVFSHGFRGCSHLVSHLGLQPRASWQQFRGWYHVVPIC